jgi:acyl-lipid omega-6 desaturase (Delta-12 desaturase)
MFTKIEEMYFRCKGSLLPSVSAMLYCHLSYLGGLALILSLYPILMVIGTFALAHGMVIASYLIHECGHNTLFKSPQHNALLGSMLNWLTGGCYGTFADLREKHMRHHVDNADVVEFDHKGYLARHLIQRKFVEVLEWLYVPAIELLMHGVLVFAPFILEEKKDQRLRTARIILIRFSLLAVLFLYSPFAYLCYLFAYVIFLTILRFMDALQHNYDVIIGFDNDAELVKYRGDRDYEQAHTFSNPVSIRHPWLNLVTLNFGYHNAHHSRPTMPWHELPKLHRALYGVQQYESRAPLIIPFRKQLASFHKSRVARVMGDGREAQGNLFAHRLQDGSAVGANGVSFLTPF